MDKTVFSRRRCCKTNLCMSEILYPSRCCGLSISLPLIHPPFLLPPLRLRMMKSCSFGHHNLLRLWGSFSPRGWNESQVSHSIWTLKLSKMLHQHGPETTQTISIWSKHKINLKKSIVIKIKIWNPWAFWSATWRFVVEILWDIVPWAVGLSLKQGEGLASGSFSLSERAIEGHR